MMEYKINEYFGIIGWKKIIGTKLTWVNACGQGIEYDPIKRELKPFVVKDMERNYEDARSVVQLQNTIKEAEQFASCSNQEKATIPSTGIEEEKEKDKTTTEGAGMMMPGELTIPDELTLPLLDKWRQMRTEERMFLFQKTPPEYIESRQGPAGIKLKYVKGNVMVQELNIAFLFNWSSTIEEVKETETGFFCRGYIEVYFGQETGYVKRSAIGTADKHKGVNNEDVAKAAAMDMIKKAASFLGFNGDVYRGEV